MDHEPHHLGPRGLTRRQFLALAGGTLALTACDPAPTPAPVSIPATSTVSIFRAGYPKAFAFRVSELLVRRLSYPDWERAFLPFGGIVGKVLAEERTDTTGDKNVQYFTRFKQRNPAKVVLLHFNGHGRLPGFETEGWWPGYWLYAAGTSLWTSVTASDTTLRVADPTVFRLGNGRGGTRSADVVVAPRGSDGRPDFSRAEQVVVTAVDRDTGTLTVLRGQYGSVARAAPFGAYVAAHLTTGPFCTDCDRIWVYNFSTRAPADPSGRTLAQAVVDGLAPRFGPGGELAVLDGIELDIARLRPVEVGKADADCDGAVDAAVFDGEDTYTAGFAELTARLREALGPSRLIVTDGSVGGRPDTGTVNGIEEEGFPSLADYDALGWSQGLLALQYWRSRGVAPQFSYPLFKFYPPRSGPGLFSRFRLALAAAVFTDSEFAFAEQPANQTAVDTDPDPSGTNAPRRVTYWDELFAGTRGTPNWLGQPAAPAVHLAAAGPDLTGGRRRGVIASNSVTPTLPVDGLPLAGRDLVLAVDVQADREEGQRAGVGRVVTATAVGGGGGGSTVTLLLTVDEEWFPAVLYFRGIGGGAARVTLSSTGVGALRIRNLRAFDGVDAMYRRFDYGAVLANPSLAPYTFSVDTLFPGATYRRIRGTSTQDPGTNSGVPVGGSLTVGPLDAVFLERA